MSVRLSLFNFALRNFMKRDLARREFSRAQVDRTRQNLDRIGTKRSARQPVERRPDTLGGVPAEWTESRSGGQAHQRVVLYCHGGAYLVGSSRAYRSLAGNIHLGTGASVLTLDYRLAPEHTYPAATDDALQAYTALLERGVAAADIVVAGDSAGGNLALATLMNIRDAGLPRPVAGVLISPWVDMTASAPSIAAHARAEAMIPTHRMVEAGRLYAGSIDLTDPRVSPLFGRFEDLPPILLHTGSREVLRDDAERAAEYAQAAGVSAQLTIWPNAPHVFHIMAPFVPEARAALNEVNDFINERFSGVHGENDSSTRSSKHTSPHGSNGVTETP